VQVTPTEPHRKQLNRINHFFGCRYDGLIFAGPKLQNTRGRAKMKKTKEGPSILFTEKNLLICLP